MSSIHLFFWFVVSYCAFAYGNLSQDHQFKDESVFVTLNRHKESLKQSQDVSSMPRVINGPTYYTNMSEIFSFSDGNNGTETEIGETTFEQTPEGKIISRVKDILIIKGYESPFEYGSVTTVEYVQDSTVVDDTTSVFRINGVGDFVEETSSSNSFHTGNVSITGAGSMYKTGENTFTMLSESTMVISYVTVGKPFYSSFITTSAISFEIYEDFQRERVNFTGQVNTKTVYLDGWSTYDIETIYTQHHADGPMGNMGTVTQISSGFSQERAGDCFFNAEGIGHEWIVDSTSTAAQKYSFIQGFALRHLPHFYS